MFDILVTIALSLNLNFSIINEKSISFKHDDINTLTSSQRYREGVSNGSIHDIQIICDDKSFYDIIIFPDVDPISDN